MTTLSAKHFVEAFEQRVRWLERPGRQKEWEWILAYSHREGSDLETARSSSRIVLLRSFESQSPPFARGHRRAQLVQLAREIR
ncbi:MAG: hypothetical protein AAGF92_01355 [Myxococcota bacterium]